MSMRFPKSARLVRPEEFAAVKAGGVRVRAGSMAIGFLAGEAPRLGIAASRAVGSAVQRNRIRRVVREFFRTNRTRFPKGDCVVIPGAGSSKLSNGELRDLLMTALQKLAAA